MAQIDTLIRGARIVDGTGNPWFCGDIALAGQRIADVTPPGRISPEGAAEVVDAEGLVICPGFIDIQSHSIIPLMVDGSCLSKIAQGVTTEIMGEAWTPAPFGGRIEEPVGGGVYAERLTAWRTRARSWTRFGHWLEALVEEGISPNVGSFLGGGTLRQYAMGLDMRAPTADELALMRRIASEAMEDGAFGLSYALIYPPDAYTQIDELIEVCKVVSRHRGLYITHIRSEADDIFAALEEAFEIGRRADLSVEIYHLKAAGQRNWSKMEQVIENIDRARRAGLDATADMYPYTASGTGLTSVLPPWAAAEGKLFDNLRDPVMRAKIKDAALHPDGTWESMVDRDGEDGVMPIGFHQAENQQYVGKRLSEIAALRGQDWSDCVFDLLLSENQRISTIYFSMCEDNVRLQLQQPWIKISTDAGGHDPSWAKPSGPVHPRAYGTYPRVLGHYVRREQILPLEDAVRKMTSSVADRLNLRDRGLVRRGLQADVVVFDPETITDNATFADPHQLATGVHHVWVNGTRVLANGQHTGATPGQFVRGSST